MVFERATAKVGSWSSWIGKDSKNSRSRLLPHIVFVSNAVSLCAEEERKKKGKKERKRKEKDRTNVATELSEYLEREITGSALVLLLRTNSFGTSSNCVTFPVSIAGETCTSFTLNVKRKREKKKGEKERKK